MLLRVLSWNLKHGRAVPSAGRQLLDEFTAALAAWSWDVALLQEVPPWWPAAFAERLRARARLVLTSRNALLPVRRAIAVRRPDLIKSNGGGANAILARGSRIRADRRQRLCWLPERRWLQGAELSTPSVWVANLHATVHDTPAAVRDGRLAARTALGWAAGLPLVLGGDFNLRELALEGFEHAGAHDVDHVFVRGLTVEGKASVLERGSLSDHAPVLVTLRV